MLSRTVQAQWCAFRQVMPLSTTHEALMACVSTGGIAFRNYIVEATRFCCLRTRSVNSRDHTAGSRAKDTRHIIARLSIGTRLTACGRCMSCARFPRDSAGMTNDGLFITLPLLHALNGIHHGIIWRWKVMWASNTAGWRCLELSVLLLGRSIQLFV